MMKMKKWIVLILSVVMVLGIAGCGSRQNGGGETSSRNESQSNEIEPSQQEGESSGETVKGIPEESSATKPAETPETSGGKTLVVYYSASGNTKEVADYIASAMCRAGTASSTSWRGWRSRSRGGFGIQTTIRKIQILRY